MNGAVTSPVSHNLTNITHLLICISFCHFLETSGDTTTNLSHFSNTCVVFFKLGTCISYEQYCLYSEYFVLIALFRNATSAQGNNYKKVCFLLLSIIKVDLSGNSSSPQLGQKVAFVSCDWYIDFDSFCLFLIFQVH